MKALQLLPGVQSGGEGQSGLYVRGGSPDQNLILLDGVPVYNASHLFGFFSVFNADAIKDVTFDKRWLPCTIWWPTVFNLRDQYEGRERTKNIMVQARSSWIASKLTFEGPIQKGKSSFIVSAKTNIP